MLAYDVALTPVSRRVPSSVGGGQATGSYSTMDEGGAGGGGGEITDDPALVSWGCFFSISPPLTSHLVFPSNNRSKPALSSLLPQPSSHPTWLLCHLLTGTLFPISPSPIPHDLPH